jgi:transcriptional regulator with XRE-family HTH domain
MDERQEAKDRRYAELVGEKLRRMRQDRGMSLQEVCSRSGGSFVVSTLSAYERGKRSLSLERLCELADIYGQSPMSLLDIEGDADFPRSITSNVPLRIRRPRNGGRSSSTSRSCASCGTIRPGTCSPSAKTTWRIYLRSTESVLKPSKTTSRKRACS